jgi:hypothetical protein
MQAIRLACPFASFLSSISLNEKCIRSSVLASIESDIVGRSLLKELLTVLFPSFQLSLGSLHVQVLSFDMLFVLVAIVYACCTLLILAIPRRALQQSAERALLSALGRQTWKIIRHDVKEVWTYIMAGLLIS